MIAEPEGNQKGGENQRTQTRLLKGKCDPVDDSLNFTENSAILNCKSTIGPCTKTIPTTRVGTLGDSFGLFKHMSLLNINQNQNFLQDDSFKQNPHFFLSSNYDISPRVLPKCKEQLRSDFLSSSHLIHPVSQSSSIRDPFIYLPEVQSEYLTMEHESSAYYARLVCITVILVMIAIALIRYILVFY